MRHITFKYAKYKCDIYTNGRYTVVVGDGGSGKSLLASYALAYTQTPKYGSLSGCSSLAAVDSTNATRILKSDVDVVIIDEEFLLNDGEDGEAMRLVKEYKHTYVIMQRAGLGHLPFGVHSVFDIEPLTDYQYRMVPHKFKIDLLRPAKAPARYLLCEDAKSGYIAALKAYEGTDVEVRSASGKGNIKRESPQSGYIVMDLCGAGATVFEIEDLLRCYENLQLCNVLSFEAEALRTQDVDVDAMLESADIPNIEEHYVRVLGDFLEEHGNARYTKHNDALAQALVTGHYDRGKEHVRLMGYKLAKDWWVPGVPHTVSSPAIKEFLELYKSTFNDDFKGQIPPEVFNMSPTELPAKFPDLMVKLYNQGDIV